METLVRLLIGLIALFMLGHGVGFWFAIDAFNERFALATAGDLGRASIRADFAGFFLGVGLLSAYAALNRNGWAAAGAALLFTLAFLGRAVSLLLDGPVDGGVPPMMFEAVSAAILLWGRSLWQTTS